MVHIKLTSESGLERSSIEISELPFSERIASLTISDQNWKTVEVLLKV